MASFSDHAPGAPRSVRGWAEWRRDTSDALRRVATPRYGVAAALAAPLIAVAFARFGPSGRFAVAAFVIASLCLLSVVDVEEHRLPNRIVLPAAAAVFVAQVALFPGRAHEWILGAFGASAALLVLHLLYPAGLGLGDVKLALLLGAALGGAVVTALALASFAAAAYALVLLVRSGAAARRTGIAFGPFLAFGTVVTLLL